ncbi:MAG: sigma-70 family RNA polymerase sigma factor [Pirellulaceae bacterium]
MSLGSTPTPMLDGLRRNSLYAWRELYEVYAPLVADWTRWAGVGGADVAEITQDVMVIVFHRVSDFRRHDRRGAFRSWLWTITRNEILRRHRDRLRRPLLFDPKQLEQRSLPERTQTPPVTRKQDLELLTRVIPLVKRRVQPRTFRAFQMLTIENRSTASVAEELDMDPHAVRQAKYRVICCIHEMLNMIDLSDLDNP